MKLYAFTLFAGIFLLNSVSAQEPKEQGSFLEDSVLLLIYIYICIFADIYEQDLMRDDKDPDGSMKKEDEKGIYTTKKLLLLILPEPDGSLYLNSINSGGPHPVNIASTVIDII